MWTRTRWLIAASCAFVTAAPVIAQTWSGTTSGSWKDGTNWQGGAAPGGGNNTILNFGGTSNASMTDDLTANPFLLNAMTFLSGSPTYSLSATTGNSLTFVNNSGGGAPSIVMNSPNNVTISGQMSISNLTVNGAGIGTLALSGPITGGTLTMSGAGTLSLGSNNNSYAGGTFVTSGTVLLTNGLAIPGSGNVTVSGTGTFNTGGLTNFSAIGTVSVSGGGKFAVSTGSGTYQISGLTMTGGSVDMTGSNGATIQLKGPITTNASSSTATWIGATNSTLFNGTSGGTTVTVAKGTTASGIDLDAGIALTGNSFTKAGGGTMRLTNLANTASFITTQGGVLRVDDASSNGGVGAFGAGSLTLNGGFIAYGGGTNATSSKAISLGPNGGGIGILTSGTTWAINNVISQSAAGPGLNVNGFGVTGTPTTLLLNANNTFTQLVLVEDLATLQVPALPSEGSGTTGTTAGPLGQSNNAPGNILLGDGGNGGTVANGRGTLFFAPSAGGTFTTDRGVTTISQYANNGGGAIGVASATTLTMTGQITGQGAFVKTGVGTLTLTNTSNNFAGGLYVENGTLNVSASGAVIPANSNVTVAPTVIGAVPTFQVSYTTGDNSAAPLGTLTLNNGTFAMTASNRIYYLNQIAVGANGGTFNLPGTNEVILTGANPAVTLSGNATWNGGLLQNASSGPANIWVAANDTLTFSGNLIAGNSAAPFNVIGAGTVHVTGLANSNPCYMSVTYSGSSGPGRVQVDDLSVNATTGASVLGETAGAVYFTLNGGTLAYSGPTQPPTSFPLTIGVNGGTIEVTQSTSTLTMSTAISGLANGLTKTGPGTLALTGVSSPSSIPPFVTVNAGTLAIGAAGAVLPSGTDVSVSPGATLSIGFTSGDNSAAPFGAFIAGTLRVPAGSPTVYLTNLSGFAGSTVNLTGSTGGLGFLNQTGGIQINNTDPSFPAIFISGNTTWTGSTSLIVNGSPTTAAEMRILPNATLTNNIPLSAAPSIFFSSPGFQLTGGGTLYMTTAPNQYSMPLTVIQGRVRVDDLSVTGGGSGSSVLGATGNLTLNGGTLQYSGPIQTTAFPIYLGPSGGTIEVSNPSTTLTLTAFIGGSSFFAPLTGPFTKTGPGTLIVTDTIDNTFDGGIVVAGGTLSVAADAQLGRATVTINPAGTVLYTANTSTSRTFNNNSGTLATAAGVNLVANGAINGGYLAGPGTFSGFGTLSGVTLAPNSYFRAQGATFTSVVNGGNVTTETGEVYTTTAFTRFTNQGSGTVIIGADGQVPVADFQTYGTLSINPSVVGGGNTALMTNAGTTPLYFNGGSRTFVGTPATAVYPNNWPNPSLRGLPTFVAGLDLNGKNAIVAGGLFVNNGYVEDSTNNYQGPGTIVADFGSLVKGAGFFQNSVQTINGGKFQAGNSPGKATFGTFVLGPGGVSNYLFAIDDATGIAGPTPDASGRVSGWGLIKSINHLAGTTTTPGDFTWTATPSDKLTVALETLINPTTVGVDVPGMMDHFDPTRPYSWPAVAWTGIYDGPTDTALLDAGTAFDTTGFANLVAGSFGWELNAADHTLSLTYAPSAVPEPGSFSLAALAATALASWRIRRKDKTSNHITFGEARC
jgi:autotransporter-associated beta strand protein